MALHTGEPVGDAEEYVGLDVHRAARICGAGHGGQILLSHTTYTLVADDLADGLGVQDLGEHRLKDLARTLHLYQAVVTDLPSKFPPLKSLSVLPNNLPRQLTSFVGREKEIAEVTRLLLSTPMLTLTGVGGAGKTRLALQVAAEVVDQFREGVWLVELASVSDPALVPQTVASVLSIREEPGRSVLETLKVALKPKQLLLVIDNAEHVIGACAQLTDNLLRSCPDLRILATSREKLAVVGETAWTVPPLSLPDPRGFSSTRPSEFEALRLFTERGSAVLPSFKLTVRNAAAMAQVCHRLDGLPLAIEMAAARVNVLTVDQILARLDDRFRLLTGGGRATLPRQRTLQAAIDWSHDLLSEEERLLLRRLSVFVGGFTLEAPENICSQGDIDKSDVLDLLTHLVEQSLVVSEEHGEGFRYRLLETVRQYAWERLVEAGEAPAIRTAHRDFFTTLAEEAASHDRSPDQVFWLDRLDTEYPNIRAAMEWSLESSSPEAALQISCALKWFWVVRGRWTEGREWLERNLSAADGAAPVMVASGLHGAGLLANYQGDQEQAVRFAEQSLSLFRELGDKVGIASALLVLGIALRLQGEHDRARPCLEESLILAQELGSRYGTARALWHLSWLILRENPVRAAALNEEAAEIFRSLGDRNGIARALSGLAMARRLTGEYSQATDAASMALDAGRELRDKYATAEALQELGTLQYIQADYTGGNETLTEALAIWQDLDNKLQIGSSRAQLGIIAQLQGQHAHAVALFEQGLMIARGLGWPRELEAGCLYQLGSIAEQEGRLDDATRHYAESLRLFKRLRANVDIPRCVEGLAGIASTRGQMGRAARLLGGAAALRGIISTPIAPIWRAEHDRKLARLRAALGEEQFSLDWAEGGAMPLDDVIDYALSSEG